MQGQWRGGPSKASAADKGRRRIGSSEDAPQACSYNWQGNRKWEATVPRLHASVHPRARGARTRHDKVEPSSANPLLIALLLLYAVVNRFARYGTVNQNRRIRH